MSKFMEDLWSSIFTPGPTPSLLIATNASFACLQVVLLLLLIATYSVHFLVLSLLSAGLWYAINWFVAELRAAGEAEAAKAASNAKQTTASGSGAGEGSDTEAETVSQPIPPTQESASKEVEIVDNAGELKLRGSQYGSKSELSTEDEWEKVSEDDKDK
jgi:hypothetical protein